MALLAASQRWQRRLRRRRSRLRRPAAGRRDGQVRAPRHRHRRLRRARSPRSTPGGSYIPDVPTEELAELVSAGLIEATTDFSRAGECDAVVICVPTPLDEMKEPDTSFMESAARADRPAPAARRCSSRSSRRRTPAPPRRSSSRSSRRSGLKVGDRPLSRVLARARRSRQPGLPDARTRPRSSAASLRECTEVAVAFYERFLDTVVPVSSTRAAEMTKLLENIFRCVNIALMNELLLVSRAHGHQHLGGRRRGQDQAVRLHAVLPGPGSRRALHPDRPVLPVVEGAPVRHAHRVHRAGRQDQRGDAVLRGRAPDERAQHAPQAARRVADPHARRRVQGQHRRHARVARRSRSPSCSSTRRPTSSTTTRSCRSSP